MFFPILSIPVICTLLSLCPLGSFEINKPETQKQTSIGSLREPVADRLIKNWAELANPAKSNKLPVSTDKKPMQFGGRTLDSLQTDQYNEFLKSYTRISKFRTNLSKLRIKSEDISCDYNTKVAENLESTETKVIEAIAQGLNISKCFAMFSNMSNVETSATSYIIGCRRFQAIQNDAYFAAIQGNVESNGKALANIERLLRQCVSKLSSSENPKNCDFGDAAGRGKKIERNISESLEITRKVINEQLGIMYRLFNDCNIEDKLVSTDRNLDLISQNILRCIENENIQKNQISGENITEIGPSEKCEVIDKVMEQWNEARNSIKSKANSMPIVLRGRINDDMQIHQYRTVSEFYDIVLRFFYELESSLVKPHYERCGVSSKLAENLRSAENRVVEAFEQGFDIRECSGMFISINDIEEPAAQDISACNRYQRLFHNGYIAAIREETRLMEKKLLNILSEIKYCLMNSRKPGGCDFQLAFDKSVEEERKILKSFETTPSQINLQLGLPPFYNCDVDEKFAFIKKHSVNASQEIKVCTKERKMKPPEESEESEVRRENCSASVSCTTIVRNVLKIFKTVICFIHKIFV